MAEAMSTGLPVVASDTPVNLEICGEAAFYFKPFSAQGLADRIEELNNSEALRNRLSAEGAASSGFALQLGGPCGPSR